MSMVSLHVLRKPLEDTFSSIQHAMSSKAELHHDSHTRTISTMRRNIFFLYIVVTFLLHVFITRGLNFQGHQPRCWLVHKNHVASTSMSISLYHHFSTTALKLGILIRIKTVEYPYPGKSGITRHSNNIKMIKRALS